MNTKRTRPHECYDTPKMPKSVSLVDEMKKPPATAQQKFHNLSFMVLVLVIVGLLFINATKTTANWIVESDVQNGIGECHYLDGDYSVVIYGVFDGATVSLKKAINPDTTNPCLAADLMKDVSVAALVGVVEETPLVGIQNAAGFYQLTVSGGIAGELINMEVARINH